MNDPRDDPFRPFREVDTPSQWEEIRRRASSEGDEDSTGARRLRHAVLAAIAAGIVLVGGVGLVLVARSGDQGDGSVDVPPTATDTAPSVAPPPVPTSTVTTIGSPPTVATSTTTTVDVTTSTFATDPQLRPIVADDVCQPISASEGSSDRNITNLFARSSRNPLPVQVIADPVLGPAGPFALLMRYYGDDYHAHGQVTIEFGENVAHGGVYDNGNGQAIWDLPDDSQGYLRSRGLDLDDIETILRATSPRQPDDVVPGFDVADTLPAGYELLHEAMLGEFGAGSGASLQCEVPSTGYLYRVGAFVTDPLGEYASVIDRPPPLEVGRIGDSIVTITGLADPAAPHVADVTTADPERWLELRAEPDPNEVFAGRRVEPIGDDLEVIVAMEPVPPLVAEFDGPSVVAMRLQIDDGIPFLEYDMGNLQLVDGVVAQEVWIDGRLRSRVEPARTGGVGGVRLSEGPLPERLVVEVRMLDNRRCHRADVRRGRAAPAVDQPRHPLRDLRRRLWPCSR